MKKSNQPGVLMLIHNFRPGPTGGAEIQAERLARSLLQRGHSVRILTNPITYISEWFDFGGNIPDAPEEEFFFGTVEQRPSEALDESNYEDNSSSRGLIHRPNFHLAYDIYGGIIETYKYLVRHRKNYDILHCHMAYGHAVVAIVAGKILRKPSIIKIACAGEFGEFANLSTFKGFNAALHVLHHADAMIAISSEVEAELLSNGFSPKRIVKIPNGVDTNYFKPANERIENNKVQFLLVGRRQPQKGVDILIRAAKILKNDGFGEQFEIQLCGADHEEYDYQSMANKLGVTQQLSFLPFQNDMRKFYHSVDCFLLPSRGEGLSNALLEAMSSGLPAIATRISGNPDVITHEKDGLLIPTESPQDLAEAMKRIILEPELRKQLGENANKRILEAYSIDYISEQYSELYRRLTRKIR
ncbi:MAG: glycosyltransferase family 4 protein [Bacteroidales bacterium]|nr:glycosyltransferase family 4 protein [Bacteroidales bacterium]